MKTAIILFFCLGVASCANMSTVRYLLWTRSNPADGDYYDLQWMDSDSLSASPFDGNKRTHFAYHGWNSNPFTSYVVNGKNAFLEIEDINFISVDWEDLAGSPVYEPSVSNMYEVANYTAQFIDFLVSETPLVTSNMHVWGHSLGGHACGMTGHYVQSGTLGRVTALDPAGPSFYEESADRRTDSTSATYVDVIHTHGGSIADAGKTGLLKAIGHVDFYPNGGASQVGCTFADTGELDSTSGCSHGRAPEYFVESILSVGSFESSPCGSWEEFEAGQCDGCGDGCNSMGYHSDAGNPGIYYLHTNPESPYAMG